jgi:hypothetical protein
MIKVLLMFITASVRIVDYIDKPLVKGNYWVLYDDPDILGYDLNIGDSTFTIGFGDHIRHSGRLIWLNDCQFYLAFNRNPKIKSVSVTTPCYELRRQVRDTTYFQVFLTGMPDSIVTKGRFIKVK